MRERGLTFLAFEETAPANDLSNSDNGCATPAQEKVRRTKESGEVKSKKEKL
jgi:hypothetical protein